MSSFLRCLAIVAALWLAAADAREPRQEPGRDSDERELAERYQANYKALHGLIEEATRLQMAYLQSNDRVSLEKAGAAWEARAGRFLGRNLAPLYAKEFAHAKYQGQDLPAGRDAKGRAAYQRIEARKVALKGYLSELRKPD